MNAFAKDIGRPVWLAMMVIGFVWFWPLGLAILAYMVWSGQLGLGGSGAGPLWSFGFWSSGNAAFDKHMADARAQLEQERADFKTFIENKLSEKDQAEFAEFSAKRKAA